MSNIEFYGVAGTILTRMIMELPPNGVCKPSSPFHLHDNCAETEVRMQSESRDCKRSSFRKRNRSAHLVRKRECLHSINLCKVVL